MPKRRDLLLGIGTAATATAAGVGGLAAADRATASTSGDDGPARVRVAHASPDAPNVDVLVDGERVLSDVTFRSVTGYLSLEPGTYEVTITAAGDPDTVAFEGAVSVEAGTDYTLAAIGELSEESFRVEPLVDRNRDLPDTIAEVRVVHASPDAPNVDVTTGHGRALAEDLSFGHVGHYRILFAGETEVAVEPASGDDDPVFETTLTLEGGETYTVFAEGYLTPDDEPTDEPFGLVPAAGDTRPDSGRLRVVHASPDAPNVDVLIDDERVLSTVHFGDVTDYLSLEPDTYRVAITAADDPDTVAFEGAVSVEAGSDYTLAAIGELSEETFRPKLLVDEGGVEPGEVGVRVLHASPDAPNVDVTTADSRVTIVDDLPFGDATDFVRGEPGSYTLEVKPESKGDDNPFDAEFDVQLAPNRLYTLVATGYFTADDESGDGQFTLVPAVTEQGD
ncbi:MAG: DUF4397 domain-containing protein [Haloarculaceae archaeon]